MKMSDDVSNAPVSSPLMVPMNDGNRFIKLMCDMNMHVPPSARKV